MIDNVLERTYKLVLFHYTYSTGIWPRFSLARFPGWMDFCGWTTAMYYSNSVEAYLKTISNTPLFAGLRPEETAALVSDLRGEVLSFQAGEIVTSAGSQIKDSAHIRLLLNGQLQLVHYDFYGNLSVIKHVLPGDITGQISAFCGLKQHEYTLIARDPCEVLQLFLPENSGKGIQNWPQLEWNLLGILSKNEHQLMKRIDIISKRTVREKILTYLLLEQEQHQSNSFDVSLNRQEMADYLCIDRTTLSSTLAVLQREGIIEVKRCHFRILKSP